jgi:hypothetical protein
MSCLNIEEAASFCSFSVSTLASSRVWACMDENAKEIKVMKTKTFFMKKWSDEN